LLDLIYTENYNPTVKLVVRAPDGAEVGAWRNMVRNDFAAGTRVILDGEALLEFAGISAAGQQWTQRHMEQNSFEYMTEYVAAPQDGTALLTLCMPTCAGRYVYALGNRQDAPQLAAWVVETPGVTESPKRFGLIMADIWNDATMRWKADRGRGRLVHG